MALAAYRHLLRSTRIAFQGTLLPFPFTSLIIHVISDHHPGDAKLLHAARTEARNAFRANIGMTEGVPAAIAHAEGVADILKKNIVQGQKVEKEGEERDSEFFCSMNE